MDKALSTDRSRHPLLLLAQELSEGDADVTDEISAWLSDAEEDQKRYPMFFLDWYYSELTPYILENYETPTEASTVLVWCLWRTGHMAYGDWKTESHSILRDLDDVSNGKLSKSPLYGPLLQRFQEESLGVGAYLDLPLPDPQLVELVEAVGYQLEAIDEDSDSFELLLIPADRCERIYRLGDEANVSFYFRRRREEVAREGAASASTDTNQPKVGCWNKLFKRD